MAFTVCLDGGLLFFLVLVPGFWFPRMLFVVALCVPPRLRRFLSFISP